MDATTYLKVTAINMTFLLAGILIAPVIVHTRNALSSVVHAQTSGKGKATEKAETPPVDNSAEYVNPNISAGVGAFYQLLAHQTAADQLMVQGIDLLKLHENTLSLLQRHGIPSAELQKALDDARVPKPLKLGPQK